MSTPQKLSVLTVEHMTLIHGSLAVETEMKKAAKLSAQTAATLICGSGLCP